MIKALNRETALKYAKTLDIQPNQYVIFDLGKEILLVGGSQEIFTEMAKETAYHFSRTFSRQLYDENENNDEKKLQEKTTLNDTLIQSISEHLIQELEKQNVKTAVI